MNFKKFKMPYTLYGGIQEPSMMPDIGGHFEGLK